MNRAEKAEVISRLSESAGKASIAVVTDFKGMTVEEMTGLRKQLRDSGVDYYVVKNSLARIAFTDGTHEVLADKLKDNNAIAFGYDDPVAPAKVLSQYVKANPKTKLNVKCGSLEGSFLDEAGIKALAQLPGREELLAKMLGTMNAVPQNFVGLLANVMRGVLNALNAIKDQKEAA